MWTSYRRMTADAAPAPQRLILATALVAVRDGGKCQFRVVRWDDGHKVVRILSVRVDLRGALCQVLETRDSIPCGRQPWMGRKEVFLTNVVCAIPASVFASTAVIVDMVSRCFCLCV